MNTENGYTCKQLDTIALNGGKVAEAGGFSTDHRYETTEQHGYGFRWIQTRGHGNEGVLVLVPKNARAAELLRQGKVKKFMEEYSLTYQEADSLYDVVKEVKYGFEHEVLKYAIATKDCSQAWKYAPKPTQSERSSWEEEWQMPHSDLSGPRWQAVTAILAKWL